jgi:hypothetical protein
VFTLDFWSVGRITIELNRCTGSTKYWVDCRDCGSLVATEAFTTETAARDYATRVFRRQPEETGPMMTFDDIRPGDRVTFNAYAGRGRNGPEYRPRTGRAVMLGPCGWVLNLGGRHGTPGIVTRDSFIKATRPKGK